MIDATPSGSDVFIKTASSLLPQDPGLVDIYDAREGGGLPLPPPPPPPCEGEACQGPLNPPNDADPLLFPLQRPRQRQGSRQEEALRQGQGPPQGPLRGEAQEGRKEEGQSQQEREGGPMRARVMLVIGGALIAALLLASVASADFGLKEQEVTFTNKDGSVATQAGSHPFAMSTTLEFNTVPDPKLKEVPAELTKDVIADLPPGFAVKPKATPRCSNADFLTVPTSEKTGEPEPLCPLNTIVGVFEAREAGEQSGSRTPVYNLEAPPGRRLQARLPLQRRLGGGRRRRPRRGRSQPLCRPSPTSPR